MLANPQSSRGRAGARIVDADGRVLSETYWSHRRNNFTDYGSLVVANTEMLLDRGANVLVTRTNAEAYAASFDKGELPLPPGTSPSSPAWTPGSTPTASSA